MADHVANLRALERWYRPSAGLSGLARAEIPQFAAEYAAALAYALRVIAAAESVVAEEKKARQRYDEMLRELQKNFPGTRVDDEEPTSYVLALDALSAALEPSARGDA